VTEHAAYGSTQPVKILSGVGHDERVRVSRPGRGIHLPWIKVIKVDRAGAILRDAGG
jgi:hypothetical protein